MTSKSILRLLFTTLFVYQTCLPTYAESQKQAQIEIVDVSAAFDTDTNLTNQQRAEILVQGGEKLMMPGGLVYAHDLFNMALVENPNNLKAQLYHKILSTALVFQGWDRRITPLVMKSGTKEDKAQLQSRLKVIPANSGYEEALIGGSQKEFRNEADVQRTMDQAIQKFDNLRLFAKANKNLKTTITAYDFAPEYKDSYVDFQDEVKQCNVEYIRSHTYKVNHCPFYVRQTYKVGRADMEAIQAISAGAEVYFAIGSAYKLNGISEVIRRNNQLADNNQSELTTQQIVTFLRSQTDFGGIRSNNKLGQIPNLASDLQAAAAWYKKFESQMCERVQVKYSEYSYYGNDQKTYSVEQQKEQPGHLFKKGACIRYGNEKGFRHDHERAQLALSGRILTEIATSPDRYTYNSATSMVEKSKVTSVETQVDYTAPFIRPTQNLVSFMPTQFNKCGEAVNVADTTLAGLFPLNDANQVLRTLNVIADPAAPCK